MNRNASLRRRLAERLPLAAAIIGMGFVFPSLLFYFYRGEPRSIMGVTAGIAFLVLGIWYAAHPFVTNERTALLLRARVDDFIGLVRELYAAANRGDEEAIGSIRQRMADSIDGIVDAARNDARPADTVAHGPRRGGTDT